jgi:acetyltransferase-like isoleucine patch superfamily enzyme
MDARRARQLKKAPWYLRYRVGQQLGSDLRRLTILATHRHCRIEFHGPVRLGPGFALDIPDRGTLVVGSGVDFRRDFVCQISGQGQVTIGDGCVFTASALVQCTTSIHIGQGCVFGQSLMLVDGKHRFDNPTKHVLEQGYDYRPLRIEKHVTVMSKCTIFADIGEGALIGAHSLVSRPIPPRCLAAGTPATPVRHFGDVPDTALVAGG